MVDVLRMPARSFGHVPTPAIVGPIEFTMPAEAYAGLGGHVDHVRPVEEVLGLPRPKVAEWNPDNPWPLTPLRKGVRKGGR